jgi:hypothetical protein
MKVIGSFLLGVAFAFNIFAYLDSKYDREFKQEAVDRGYGSWVVKNLKDGENYVGFQWK